MKTRTWRPRRPARMLSTGGEGRWSRLLVAAAFALSVASCAGGGEDEGGIIGTGLQLKGTVPTERAFARSEIEVRSADGERSQAVIAADGRYAIDDLGGEGPWLLRVDLGNDEAYYAVTFTPDIQNVHAYSDLAIRSFFSSRGQDIDAVFAAAGALDPVPSAGDMAAIDARILALIAGSLDAYQLGGTNLGTVAFAADDTGVDRFLDANPVLIEDAAFTVIIVDPDSGTQTSAAVAVPLSADLGAADDTPPAAPTVLRVLPSALDEIVLVWEGASDDVGIAGYEVLRDGRIIASTAYPVLLDSPLEPMRSYRYEIVAIDASGNRSQPSASGSAQTLQAPDVTPPPAPQELQLAAGIDSVRLTWQQSMIGDVAAFLIERGTTRTNLAPLSRVTSTFALNAGLNSGTEYCYRVTAVDASLNESAATPVSCVSTAGGLTSTPDAPPAVNGASAGSLIDIDVSGLECTEEVTTFSINGPVTLSGTCLRVPRSITVGSEGQLTIAAGTVLKFASNTDLSVETGGSLSAVGTADAPIVLSSLDRSPGYWGGVSFRRSNSIRNRLENVVIEYGGRASGAALSLTTFNSSVAPVRLSVDNLLLRHSAGAGFRFNASHQVERFTRIQSTRNAIAGVLEPENASILTSDSRFTGNAVDLIRMPSGSVNAAAVWNRIDVPLLTDRVEVNAPLTIAAGTVLQFERDGKLDIGREGSLTAIGTAEAPILFTGEQPIPGFWVGFRFFRSASTANRLEHVSVEYAGATQSQGTGAIVTSSETDQPVRLDLSNVTLRFSAGPGFRFETGTRLGAFDNIVSTSNAVSGRASIATLSGFQTGLDFTGNTRDELDLFSEELSQPMTIASLGVPYTFASLRVDSALTIDPGVTLRARADGAIDMSSQGSLDAVGTAAQPIVIEGMVAQQGYWDGLSLSSSNGEQNRLEFVTLTDGGGDSRSGPRGNLLMECGGTLPARIAIANSRIENSAGWGIYRRDADCTVTLGTNVTFADNLLGEVNPVP